MRDKDTLDRGSMPCEVMKYDLQKLGFVIKPAISLCNIWMEENEEDDGRAG
jgi:hypothetical protein